MKRPPAPAPSLPLSLYSSLAVTIVEARGRAFTGAGQSSGFFKNQEGCGSFWRLVFGKTKLKAVCGNI